MTVATPKPVAPCETCGLMVVRGDGRHPCGYCGSPLKPWPTIEEEAAPMTADTTTVPVVTDDEAAAINAARDALAAIKERAQYLAGDPPAGPDGWIEARSQDYGRLTGYAAVAFNLLFDVLNVAHAYCNAPLTDAQLHNREDA